MKKIFNTALVTALMLGTAATAQAATEQVNMYGASAQLGYWDKLGSAFMTSLGCTGYSKATTADTNFYAIKGTGCTTTGVADTVIITYGSVSSLDGIKAAKEVEPLDDKNNCAANNTDAYRQVVDTTDPSKFTASGTGDTPFTCGDIQLGTSDVEGPSFTQSSTGGLNGPGTEDFTPDCAPEDVTGLLNVKPTVVPFAFYANNALPQTGAMTNLTRTQAVNLFANKVSNWNQFNGFTPNKGVVLCMRHAGSGTHATLDKAVMRGDANLPTSEIVAEDPGYAADVYFYQSSSGMKECLTNNGLDDDAYIAVGYMDADSSATDAHQLTYQGAAPLADNIKTGVYDFWSLQNVYFKSADNTLLVQKMMTFAKANVPSSKATWWTTYNDLKVFKPTDTAIPLMKQIFRPAE
jgi:hypothetical protein